MKTWSAETAFIKAYTVAAVGIQRALDAFGTVERITRPMGHDADEFDESAAEAFLGDTFEGRRVMVSDALPDHITGIVFDSKMFEGTDHFIGPVLDEPVCACCFERGRATGSCLCAYCIERGVDAEYYSRHERDETPNPNEPGLTDDELIGVRELLERFGLADVPTPSAVGTSSPADDGHSPVPPAGQRSRYDDLGGGPW